MLGPAHLQCIVPMGREANAWPIGAPWRTTPGRILLGNRGPRYTPKRIALRCLGPPICSALFPWDARRTLGEWPDLGEAKAGEGKSLQRNGVAPALRTQGLQIIRVRSGNVHDRSEEHT